MDKSACRCSIGWFSHWLYRMTRSYTNRQRKGFLFLHWPMCSFVEGEFKACQSIHERNRQHWNFHTGQTEKEGISSLEESLHDESGLLGDVSKLRCWQYCIGKVFVTIWSDIRMETCLNTEREGGQSTGIHSVPGKTGILLLALQRNTRPLQFDSRPQKKH